MARDTNDDTVRDNNRTDRGVAAQKEKYGGFNFGAAFFGWLVAVGMAALLVALLSAIGSAIAITVPELNAQNLQNEAETVGIVSGALLLLSLALAYYAGGYVAGRMSRFDGGRQGFGVWLIGIIIMFLLAIAGAVLGSQYNLLEQINLPRIPVDEGDLTTGGLVTLLVGLVVTLLAAILGGKAGRRYHTKVDRVAHDSRIDS